MSAERADTTDHDMFTLMEAAAVLRIGRSTAYELANEFIRTRGASGLPVIRIGRQLRVTRAALDDVMRHGTAARLRRERSSVIERSILG